MILQAPEVQCRPAGLAQDLKYPKDAEAETRPTSISSSGLPAWSWHVLPVLAWVAFLRVLRN